MFCTDVAPPIYFLFSTDALPLLYYSHLPAFFVALGSGIYLFYKNRQSLAVKVLLILNILFCLLVFFNLILWTNVNVNLITIIWPLSQLIQFSIPLVSLYLLYVFLNDKPVKMTYKLFWFALFALTGALIFSPWNILYFDLTNCELVTSPAMDLYQNIVSGLIFVWLVVVGVVKVKRAANPKDRLQKLLFSLGLIFFVALLIFTWQVASVLGLFALEQLGLFGMLIFTAILSYLIVKFHTFNIKLIGVKALLVTQGLVIASLLFVQDLTYIYFVIVLTLVVYIILSAITIRGVKREIKAKEREEMISLQLKATNDKLALSNEGQEDFLHFLSHEVKNYLTKNQFAYESILSGDYGLVPESGKSLIKEASESNAKGRQTVENILKSADLSSGKVEYNFKVFSLTETIKKLSLDYEKQAKHKGLSFEVGLPSGEGLITGDQGQLVEHVFKNLIDNALNYTLTGGIKVKLTQDTNNYLFSIEDTGVGLSNDDQKKLFTEGGKGRESAKINVHSTGHGLFIAKKIVEAHQGKIWAESEGSGHGSTFYVKLPVKPIVGKI